jgi:uncharacterized damage-inducible protein DinB
MLIKQEWEKRVFPTIADNRILPCILERLEGTPVRITEKVARIPGLVIDRVIPGKWSIKEEIGHLIDLEPLWTLRIWQITSWVFEMAAADMTNKKTHTASHNDRQIGDLLAGFRNIRQQTVDAINALTLEDLDKYSFHPRLKRPMRIIDLAYFVAEHDDHHLAQITYLSKSSIDYKL